MAVVVEKRNHKTVPLGNNKALVPKFTLQPPARFKKKNKKKLKPAFLQDSVRLVWNLTSKAHCVEQEEQLRDLHKLCIFLNPNQEQLAFYFSLLEHLAWLETHI